VRQKYIFFFKKKHTKIFTTMNVIDFIAARADMDPFELRAQVAAQFPSFIANLSHGTARALDFAYCGSHGSFWWKAYDYKGIGETGQREQDHYRVTYTGLYTCHIEFQDD
jgi:hypothetical protein